MKERILIVIVLVTFAAALCAQPPRSEYLWPDGAPGALGAEEEDKPMFFIFSPPANLATGTGVLVCPGGGYRNLAMDHEGRQIGQWLNSLGVTAFVLRYRLGPKYHHPIPLGDAQRAMIIIRERAKVFGVCPGRIGVWGFSAGGHLASTLSTHSPPETRPNFAILAYPVISFTAEYVHKGSRTNLLGDNPDPALVSELSNELRVTKDTPPTFLFHTNEDTGVPPENSVLYYLALRRAGVPAEMHIYERGRHGVGLAPADAALSSWPGRLADWLRGRGLLR
jgi:acetyl esterase/lipase